MYLEHQNHSKTSCIQLSTIPRGREGEGRRREGRREREGGREGGREGEGGVLTNFRNRMSAFSNSHHFQQPLVVLHALLKFFWCELHVVRSWGNRKEQHLKHNDTAKL